ncbi:TetR/AcrR family transcriptional regulator [Streptomyces sp. NPDC058001]|uniref:TetR/AcrR family transcriptional regulator n=1 Tax=Streptomyces sp. NPDC058001 TaxID=3346300 RepID=UPI0036F0DC5A
MTMNDPVPGGVAAETGTTWREMAVARSVDPARLRAEKRVQRFLDAALELISGDSGKDFTVQEVVKQSGQSLRSFYQYFAGKHELLLALFEESVNSTAQRLRDWTGQEDEPLERLHRFTVEYYRLCRTTPKDSKARRAATLGMAEFAQQLLTEHPKEAARAFVPLTSLLVEILDETAAAGGIREGLDHRRVAGTVLQATMFSSFSVTIGGLPVDDDLTAEAEALWELLLHGMAPEVSGRPDKAVAKTAARSATKAPAKSPVSASAKTPAKAATKAPAKAAKTPTRAVRKTAPKTATKTPTETVATTATKTAAKAAPAKKTAAKRATKRTAG